MGLLCTIALVSAAPCAGAATVLNEVQVSTTGTDWEFFEIAGVPGTSLAELSLVSIESDAGSVVGRVDAVVPLSGTIPADGFWWAGSGTGIATYSGTCGAADGSFSDNTLENGSTTNLLVRGFSGSVGLDLDTNDDGVLDLTPWTDVVDGVAIQDAAGDFAYGGVPALGPDGTFLPSGVKRLPDSGPWSTAFLNFSSPDGTPGASNVTGCQLPVAEAHIHEVQGDGPSVVITARVRVEAIVVGDFQEGDQLRGFFLQEEDSDADANASTSEGIFVFCSSCPTQVQVGDLVRVTGTPSDFFGMSQITATQAAEVEVVASGKPLPTPVVIDLPASGSTQVAATFEHVEGMLVKFADSLYVSEYFQLARYGQLVLTAGGRPAQFTDANEPSVTGYALFLAELNSRRIILDDDNNIQNDAIVGSPDEPYFWPRPGLSNSSLVRGGDRIDDLTGVMHWSFAGQPGTDAWRIRPVDGIAYEFVVENPRPTSPTGGGLMRVASFNVLNYFTTLDSRGADSNAELNRQREKTVAAICAMDADVVGLIEIENNSPVAIEDLLNDVNGVNAACGPYGYIDTATIGGDEIAVAFIFRLATVSPVGEYAVLDSAVDSRFVDALNRPALAQTFAELDSGEALTIVVNHLKSKGSPCDSFGDPDLGDGQGNCNQTRTDAAAAMVDWLATDPTGSGDPDILIIGDLNAYRMEDPIDAIEAGADDTPGTADDYTDLLDFLVGPGAYSYVFDGQLGYLDHALANAPVLPQVVGASVWHINADEIPVFDYNDGVRDSGEASFERESTALEIYSADAYRSSDHDPVIVDLGFDSDADGVLDGEDYCPGTVIPEAVPASDLRGNRWALTDSDLVFDTEGQVLERFTTTDTAGCSCEQIIAATAAGNGHEKFGCSIGLVREWIEGVR